MPQGMQVFGPDGRAYVDMSSNISQTQGTFITNAANGSAGLIQLPANKRRWYFVSAIGDSQAWKGKLPGVTVSGNTITWQYLHSTWFGQFSQNAIITYGYY